MNGASVGSPGSSAPGLARRLGTTDAVVFGLGIAAVVAYCNGSPRQSWPRSTPRRAAPTSTAVSSSARGGVSWLVGGS